MKRSTATYFSLAAALACAQAAAQSTVLTFDFGGTNGTPIPQNYGDRVMAATTGSYSYGGSGFFTPSVTVGYSGSTGGGLRLWTNNYNDLVNVGYYGAQNLNGDLWFRIDLVADPGRRVDLHGFDLGHWGGSAASVPAVIVTNEAGQVLFQQLDVPLEPSSSPNERNFAFTPALRAQAVRIHVELTGMASNHGNVGIDNVHFSQVTASFIGQLYCVPQANNSTGVAGQIVASGSTSALANDFHLVASDLPVDQFGYFLASRTQAAFNPPASSGTLCLAQNIGRFNAPQRILRGPVGRLTVDLWAIPVNPTQPVMSGQTWNFQCWYRDVGTSNFTDALSVLFTN